MGEKYPGVSKAARHSLRGVSQQVFVASGDDGMLRVFRADTLELLDSIKLDLGPNRVVYDPHTKLLYVGYGGKDAAKDYGEVGIIEAKTEKHIGDIKVDGHPGELLLDQSGKTLFVFVSATNKVQVVDTNKREVVSTWPVSSQRNGDGAFDERTHRLFGGTRTPPRMLVVDSQTGTEIANLATVEGMDGVYFDAAHKRVYVSGAAIRAPGMLSRISKTTLATAKLSGKSRQDLEPVLPSGRRNSTVTTWPRPLTTRNRPRFSCSNQSSETLLALLKFLGRKKQ